VAELVALDDWRLQPLTVDQAEALGYRVVERWDGQPAITVEDARREVQRREAERAVYEREWTEHLDACERWMAERAAAVHAAFSQELDRHGLPGVIGGTPASTAGGVGRAAARQAGTDAGADFERSHPRPLFRGHTTIPLQYVDEGEEGSMTARVRAGVRKLVRRDIDTGATWREVG
jgi:hypothetical protein